MKHPEDYMQDSAGRLVPRANVRPQDLLQDELVRKLHAGASSMSGALRAFRAESFADIEAFRQLLAEEYKTTAGGQKGNLTLTSYDGSLRLTVAIGDSISFGPEIHVAKELIDACLTRWSDGANANLRAIVLDAFDVAKEGKLRADKILGLRRIAIDDPDWLNAMEAISDAVKIDSSKSYIRFHEKGRDGEFKQVPLDVAKV